MPDIQHIKDFTPGTPLQIRRRKVNPDKTQPIDSAQLHIMNDGRTVLSKEVRLHVPASGLPAPETGFISNRGASDPFVTSFHFNLSNDETRKLTPGKKFLYEIKLKNASGSQLVESGVMSPHTFGVGPPPPPALPLPVPGDAGYSSPTSYTTYSDACQTVGGRYALIIDGFLDAELGDYRQLKVWDEKARRKGDDPTQFKLTYEYINQFTGFEVFDGYNSRVDPSDVTFDYRNGSFSVDTDDGNQDYFVTYTFNFFPESILRMFVQQCVLELNFIGVGAGGGYLTHYQTLESMPMTWDGIIALGAMAKSWSRLASNVLLWRNWLIFDGDTPDGITPPGGATAQQAATTQAAAYQTMFETLGTATKFDKFISYPTEIYQYFTSTGFGSFGMFGPLNSILGGKYQGMTINRMGVY